MLARRFLGCVFVLTLLAVAAGFAFFEFGGNVLTRAATPSGHFRAPPQGDAGPDYAAPASWIANPALPDDPSRWHPRPGEGVSLDAQVEPKRAATFFIHPTTYLERDRWNAPLDPGGDAQARAGLFVRSQASAFNGVSQVWAPKYRQAAFGAFLLTSADATRALDLAYRDVLKAFDAFIAAQPADRPLILAGHSQGSLHLLRLLRDRRDVLKGRLVAAYIVGWPVSATADLPAMGLKACASPAEAGCVLSWQSFGEPANTSLVTGAWVGTTGLTGAKRQRRDMVCTSPVAAGTAAQSLIADRDLASATLEPRGLSATCDDGFLSVRGRLPDYGPFVLPGNNYHVFDYALFWGNIRQDAARRLAGWKAA